MASSGERDLSPRDGGYAPRPPRHPGTSSPFFRWYQGSGSDPYSFDSDPAFYAEN